LAENITKCFDSLALVGFREACREVFKPRTFRCVMLSGGYTACAVNEAKQQQKATALCVVVQVVASKGDNKVLPQTMPAWLQTFHSHNAKVVIHEIWLPKGCSSSRHASCFSGLAPVTCTFAPKQRIVWPRDINCWHITVVRSNIWTLGLGFQV